MTHITTSTINVLSYWGEDVLSVSLVVLKHWIVVALRAFLDSPHIQILTLGHVRIEW